MTARHVLPDGDVVTFRPATDDDVSAIAGLIATVYAEPINQDWMKWDLKKGHGVVGMIENELVAFRLQRRYAPDIVGAGSLVVRPEYRGLGIGLAVVRYFEQTIPEQFELSVVFNTDGYETVSDKPDATGFWEQCGYRLVEQTALSRMLVKRLR